MIISTFSIVARDPETGALAVAGNSNGFCYGRWVPHLKSGAGALATQGAVNLWYAKQGLEDLDKGLSAQETLDDLLKQDPDTKGMSQVLFLDREGNTAVHTGKRCYGYAADISKKNLAIAGNTLANEDVVAAMESFYESSDEPFALKLIKTLQAGEEAGGDIRGKKSAALKIVTGTSNEKGEDVLYDIRVDKNNAPLQELEKLYYTAEAYKLIDDAWATENDMEALLFFQQALVLDPGNPEIMFWIARKNLALGNTEEANHLKKQLFAMKGNWEEYWRRFDARERS